MLELIKDALRISSNDLDAEIRQYIDACRKELMRSGIDLHEADSAITQMYILYCKAMLDFQEKGDRYKGMFVEMVKAYSMSEGYRLNV